MSARTGKRVSNADTAGAVGSWQVARRDGTAFGRFPATNMALLSAARRHKSRNAPASPHFKTTTWPSESRA